MTKPMPNKVEVALQFPDKVYIGNLRADIAFRRSLR
jgi:hypothetical protein